MIACDKLIHPFQNDPGVSQRQRIIDDLLSGSAKIDGRSLADLLDYFVQLSRHINYYGADLSVSDWQPFFQKSIPFSIAAITKYDSNTINEKIALYQKLFEKYPSPSGLQLLVHYMYYSVINSINTWYVQVQGSELPVAFALEKLIRDKLRNPVKEFICYTNMAVRLYCIKPINFNRFSENEVWDFDLTDLYAINQNCKRKGNTKREKKIALYDAILSLLPSFLDVIRVVTDAAAMSLEQSLVPLKAELQEKHSPHLAILFAFLKLFQYLQNDLNSYTKKHLDFFYKNVLQLKSREATPDKAHIVFEIQNQLKKYLLEKGLEVKDGKDDNKAEVVFALNDEIVVNKTQVADKRTLFLNYQTHSKKTYLEGVYMAPNADKADGIDKDFKDDDPKSFETLGAKNSKYIDPENKFIQPYPNARLGFILASPVLLLNEGQRTIDITLACELKNNYCKELTPILGERADPCCEGKTGEGDDQNINKKTTDIDFKSACELYKKVEDLLTQPFYYISQPLIQEAIKKGVSAELIDTLKQQLVTQITREDGDICYCPIEKVQYDRILKEEEYKTMTSGLEPQENKILSEIIKPKRIFNIFFSGEKEWIAPSEIISITLNPASIDCEKADPYSFTLNISAILEADKPSITFYDKEQFKEDFNTTLPLVKIALDDKIKLIQETSSKKGDCCLEKEPKKETQISLYHFFRNVIVKGGENTTIDVKVCGLKNFIVQNDESVQDVNSPVYPFGTRPKINGNFYIGSEEIFLKKWSDIIVNINWKDLPSFSPPAPDPLNGKPFQYYYNGYQDFLINSGVEINVVEDDKFRVQIAILQDGTWNQWKHDENCAGPGDPKCQLFQKKPAVTLCNTDKDYTHQFQINRVSDFSASGLPFPLEEVPYKGIKQFDVSTRQSFLRLTLKCQDFQHDKYPFILARQMTALGKLPEIVDGAVYYGVTLGGPLPQFVTLEIPQILQEIIDNYNLSLNPHLLNNLEELIGEINDLSNPPQNVNNTIWTKLFVSDDPSTIIPNDAPTFGTQFINPENHSDYYVTLKTILDWLEDLKEKIEKFKDKGVVIPNEPWTPIIKGISLNYTAQATLTDIDLIHLYPYEGTYKHEEIELQPTLLPTFCDEGTLFLGLKELVPGSNVNMLFQLAEATADSESEGEVNWFYLENNQWKMLRQGFEVLEDATDGLTTSGIVKFALPANMTSENTILPKGLHWIKVAIPQNSRSVSETIGIHAQAIQVTFTNEAGNDKLRLSKALSAGSIAKLKVADASVKKVNQLYDSFGGRVPEAEGHFYIRVSERLRHKGRAIQKFDYERLVLEAFPQLFKVKCINHSFALEAQKYFNDFPMAPGYVLLAVIPDLNQLKAAESFEPRVPVSLLEKVKAYLRLRTSPFVRLRIMNPRYEKVHFCLKVKLYLGKDENYYKEKLKQDLREFLAPWAVGQYDKLTFGQCIYRSDIVRFLETRDYLDYIISLGMKHEKKDGAIVDLPYECPITPRSILIAGNIDVCIQQKDCEKWEECKDNDEKKDCCGHDKILLAEYCKVEEPLI